MLIGITIIRNKKKMQNIISIFHDQLCSTGDEVALNCLSITTSYFLKKICNKRMLHFQERHLEIKVTQNINP